MNKLSSNNIHKPGWLSSLAGIPVITGCSEGQCPLGCPGAHSKQLWGVLQAQVGKQSPHQLSGPRQQFLLQGKAGISAWVLGSKHKCSNAVFLFSAGGRAPRLALTRLRGWGCQQASGLPTGLDSLVLSLLRGDVLQLPASAGGCDGGHP